MSARACIAVLLALAIPRAAAAEDAPSRTVVIPMLGLALPSSSAAIDLALVRGRGRFELQLDYLFVDGDGDSLHRAGGSARYRALRYASQGTDMALVVEAGAGAGRFEDPSGPRWRPDLVIGVGLSQLADLNERSRPGAPLHYGLEMWLRAFVTPASSGDGPGFDAAIVFAFGMAAGN